MNWADEAASLQTPQTSPASNWLSQLGSFVQSAGQGVGSILNRNNPNSTTGLNNPNANLSPMLLIGGGIALVVLIIAVARR